MTKVSPTDVVSYANGAGFSLSELPTAVALAFAENPGRDINAQHRNNDGTIDIGLWQINNTWISNHNFQEGMKKAFDRYITPTDLENPLVNAMAARWIKNNTASGWNNWCTFWPSGCNFANQNSQAVKDNWFKALADAAAAIASSGLPVIPGAPNPPPAGGGSGGGSGGGGGTNPPPASGQYLLEGMIVLGAAILFLIIGGIIWSKAVSVKGPKKEIDLSGGLT